MEEVMKLLEVGLCFPSSTSSLRAQWTDGHYCLELSFKVAAFCLFRTYCDIRMPAVMHEHLYRCIFSH